MVSPHVVSALASASLLPHSEHHRPDDSHLAPSWRGSSPRSALLRPGKELRHPLPASFPDRYSADGDRRPDRHWAEHENVDAADPHILLNMHDTSERPASSSS